MASAPVRRCSGCGDKVQGRCDKCHRRNHDRHVRKPDPFLNSRAWRKLSKAKLAADPLCEDCLECDRITPAVEVHHLKKRSLFPELALVWSNLLSSCKRCHAVRTRRGE